MKRFLRYLLLTGYILTIGVWVWSYNFKDSVTLYRGNSSLLTVITINSGRIDLLIAEIKQQENSDIDFRHFRATRKRPIASSSIVFDIFGLTFFDTQDYVSYGCLIPIWIIFLIASILTLMLWYHPIKNWLRGTDRQGFEVELKTESKDHGQDIHATDKPV